MRPTVSILCNPFTSAILAAFLAADAALLPTEGYQGGRSTIGRWIAGRSLDPEPHYLMCGNGIAEGWYVKHTNGVAPFVGDGLEMRQFWESHQDVAAALSWEGPSSRRCGFWAITRTETVFELRASYGANLTPAEQLSARGQFVDGPEDWWFAGMTVAQRERFRHEDFVDSAPIYSGYLHNAISLTALAALLASLAWAPRTPAYIRSLQSRDRAAQGFCPACAYNLAGLAPETPCPECGTKR